jgi:hypothetical protein
VDESTTFSRISPPEARCIDGDASENGSQSVPNLQNIIPTPGGNILEDVIDSYKDILTIIILKKDS